MLCGHIFAVNECYITTIHYHDTCTLSLSCTCHPDTSVILISTEDNVSGCVITNNAFGNNCWVVDTFKISTFDIITIILANVLSDGISKVVCVVITT